MSKNTESLSGWFLVGKFLWCESDVEENVRVCRAYIAGMMHHRFFALVLCAVSTAGHAQVLLDNHDDVRHVMHGDHVPFLNQLGNGSGGMVWPGWHGTLVEYVPNPYPDAVNGSAQCMSYLRNPSETYDVIIIRTDGLADVSAFVAGTAQMQLDVFSPVPGVAVEITLEDAETVGPSNYPVGRHSNYRAVTTTGGQWETLTFDFQSQPDASIGMDDVDNIVILMNPGFNISEQYYLDNLRGPALDAYDCENQPGTDPDVVADFDCHHGLERIYSDGRLFLFPNPAPSADNSSAKCLEYTRNGAVTDDVWVGRFAGGPRFPETTMTLRTLDASAPSTLLISLQDDQGNELLLVEGTTTLPGSWENHTFNVSSLAGIPVHRFVVLYRPGIPEPATLYVDDWTMDVTVGVSEIQASLLTAVPNPVQDGAVRISGCTAGPVWVMGPDGRVVWSGRCTTGMVDVPVQGWSAGLYVVRTEQGARTRFVVE